MMCIQSITFGILKLMHDGYIRCLHAVVLAGVKKPAGQQTAASRLCFIAELDRFNRTEIRTKHPAWQLNPSIY